MRSLHFGGNRLLPSRWQWYNEEVIASSNAAAPYQRESDGGSPGLWEFDKDEEMQSLLFFHENMKNRSTVGSTCN